MGRVRIVATVLGVCSVGMAATVHQLTMAALNTDGTMAECVSVKLTGFTDEKAKAVFDGLTSSEGAKVLQVSCSEEEKRLGLTSLGSCTVVQSNGDRSLFSEARAYEPSQTFGDGGFKAQCAESKGTWKATAAGVKAEAQAKADEKEAKRIAALPKATAEEIGDAYEANEIAADARYKGKTFMVTGRVHSVQRDHRKKVYIRAEGGNMFIGVHLYVADEKRAAEFEPGELVEGECTGRGKGMLGAPTFTCR